MNRETEILNFREKMLPKYMEMVNDIKNLKTVTKTFEVHHIDKNLLKQCSRCGEWLPKTEYHHENRSYCRKCEKIATILRNEKKKAQ